MGEFKILVTSQKGGVGKSTISANLAAYSCRQGRKTALLDYDLHGSSSKWLKGAPQIGIEIKHSPLPLEVGGSRPMQEASQKLRRLCYTNEIVIADLTWTDSMTADFLFQFDMVIVPTSVSEIELNATSEFLQRFRWIFESTIHIPPKLLICPTRVSNDQMSDDSVFKQHFPFRLMLSPAILESQSARKLFQRGFICDSDDACCVSFNDFGSAVLSVVDHQNLNSQSNKNTSGNSRMQALLRLAAKYGSSNAYP